MIYGRVGPTFPSAERSRGRERRADKKPSTWSRFMPIAFSCSCGKAMKAKEAFAGRKIKCVQCGKVVTIPQAETAAADDLTPSSEPPAESRSAPDVKEKARGQKPAAAPLAKPEGRPVLPEEEDSGDKEAPSEPPLAKPAARPVLTQPKAEAPPASALAMVHVWVDRSLVQQPTPWLPGDEERFQGIKVPREGLSRTAVALAALLLIGGLGAAGWFLIAW
jgi:hypothetical protein